MMEIGARNRAVAETKMNERSSRSHSVLTVIVDGISHVTGQRTHGCLHLIDLAGARSFPSYRAPFSIGTTDNNDVSASSGTAKRLPFLSSAS